MSRIVSTAVAWPAISLLSQGAHAGEHSLEFKLLVMRVEVKNFEIANIEGQNVSLMKMSGVAYFKEVQRSLALSGTATHRRRADVGIPS